MMELDYIKTDPTGNITVLVTTPVPENKQAQAAEEIMERMPDCQQVGFVSSRDGYDAALRMMGGEFCGNASLSLAAVLAEERGMEGLFSLCVSGADGPVKVYITKQGDRYSGSVSMPLPLEIPTVDFGRYKVPVVVFPGIAHAIVKQRMPQALAEMLIREWSARVKADAFGIMLLDEAGRRMTPVVYVRSTDTVVAEGSCASGTAAAAALTASVSGSADIELSEPCGTMAARARAEGGRVAELELVAGVRLVRRGSVTVL